MGLRSYSTLHCVSTPEKGLVFQERMVLFQFHRYKCKSHLFYFGTEVSMCHICVLATLYFVQA
uniref:Uncharacterized protein n=1 Tax=Anguilla anguilla TaxID=7936 RepID=A0A0E9WKM6_ANGAN